MAEPILPLPPSQPAPGQRPDEAVKGCLGWITSLLIAGVVAEMLYNLSPKAAYLFVAIVIIGYAGTGGHVQAVTDFFTTVQGAK